MIHRIGIVIKPGDERAASLAADITRWLDDCGYHLLMRQGEKALPGTSAVVAKSLTQHVEMMLVFGGDGTLLGVGRECAGTGVPILGINLGRLGFLTDTPAGSVRDALTHIFANRYKTIEHHALQVEVVRDGQCQWHGRAMNDVVLHRRDTRPVEFELYVHQRRAFSLHADGMVLATPAGSTAYALSAGGPIVHPGVQALTLVPVCPHTLSNRPLVIPMDEGIEMRLCACSRPASLSLDGQLLAELQDDDVVRVHRGGKIRLIYLPDHHYFETLRNKLHWADGVGAAE